MFRNWGFLLGEIWVLLLLAALLGLFVGWLLWARKAAALSAEHDADRYAIKEKQGRISSLEEELRKIRVKQTGEISALNSHLKDRDQKIADMTRQLQDGSSAASDVDRWRAVNVKKDARILALEAQLNRQTESRSSESGLALAGTAAATSAVVRRLGTGSQAETSAFHERSSHFDKQDFGGHGATESVPEGSKPEVLSGPRGSGPDDLKQIKGIGPKLETLLNEMGFYHFDQVAAWGPSEVAWVDANIQGFTGRVSRDGWVAQAKALALE